MPSHHRQRGQAAVELVALVPALALLVIIGWQIALAAHAWGTAGSAARVGARAVEVGRSGEDAARRALPAAAARRARIDLTGAAGPRRAVRVSVEIPRVIRWLPPLGRVEREAAVAPPAGAAP
ncbi:MAG: TadE/TadG family type IV pilus assembly protein [Thermoleophilia bacterium]